VTSSRAVPLRARTLILVWSAIAFFFAAQNAVASIVRGRSIDWQWDVIHELIYWSLWGLLTPLIARQASRWWLEPGRATKPLLLHALMAALLAPAQVLATYAINALEQVAVGGIALRAAPAWVAGFRVPQIVLSFTGFLYYWLILGALHAVAYRRLYEAQRRETARAQLDALRAQLQPHFLFNVLNSISVLTEEDPRRAKRMLVRLGDLLRSTLRQSDEHEVALEEELAFLDRYLDIQRVRFEERLRVELRASAEVRRARVPMMVLQPIVENAVRHAIEPRIAGGRVEINIQRAGDRLLLEVCDDGPGLGSEREGRAGIGLSNTRARLRSLYGEAQGLQLSDRPEGGLKVQISIPWRLAE
jgi:hypothetical protein